MTALTTNWRIARTAASIPVRATNGNRSGRNSQ